VDGFHDYALEWDPGEIRWYVDGELWASQSAWWSCSRREGDRGVYSRGPTDLNAWPAPFDQPFHLLVNLAVGGGLPGLPDASTQFLAEMKIDYIRVFEREP
jgi:beta-glucanase (GH16 family)